MDQSVSEFFTKYEIANGASDISAVGSLYGESFLFAGPNGAQTVRREDFLKVIPRMKAHFESIGLTGTHLCWLEVKELDARYVLVKATWEIAVKGAKGGVRSMKVLASYVLQRVDGRLFIVFQLDHQDLETVVKSQGIADVPPARDSPVSI